MTDEIDRQLERDLPVDELRIRQVRMEAARIPVGEPGECRHCGEEMPRLVRGACARCRDRLGLP